MGISDKRVNRRSLLKGIGAAAAIAPAGGLLASCTAFGGSGSSSSASGLGSAAQDVVKARNLTPANVSAAVETYMPSGVHDQFIMLASGGHAGQMLVIGLPSMRILKEIGVFTPEPWQGWGFSDEAKGVLEGAKVNDKLMTWGDSHHPAMSETNGSYDGQFVFINDKAHSRIAVVDLRDFVTKQIVKNPLMMSDHACFVTPDTDYVVEGSQYAVPLGWQYAPIDQFKSKYRGAMTFWKFDRASGRILPEQSFAIELPPYFQDLGDSGKLDSDGWVFLNSFNTEMAVGKAVNGMPLEIGASQRDMDYMTAVNWKKAAEVAKTSAETINGMKVIRIKAAVDAGILYEIPEPKSPHGVDVTPKGDYIVVAGKLDPHVTVYSFKEIQEAIKEGKFDHDAFGIPVLDFNACMKTQIEVGLGPLHTQFDNQGYAYTSLFIDSAVARWTLGDEYRKGDGWKFVDKIPVQYNVGHLAAVEGDTVQPQGKYLVSLNKWAIDRFDEVGPLHPQNFQLIDISGEKMQLLYDMPIGMAEPHYAQIVRAELLKPWTIYPQVGWDPEAQTASKFATTDPTKAGVVRDGSNVTVNMTAMRSNFSPDLITVKQGDKVTWHVTNIENTEDATHGFALPGQNINLSLEPGATLTITFTADDPGVYPWYCTEFCSALHLEMMGYFIIEPA